MVTLREGATEVPIQRPLLLHRISGRMSKACIEEQHHETEHN